MWYSIVRLYVVCTFSIPWWQVLARFSISPEFVWQCLNGAMWFEAMQTYGYAAAVWILFLTFAAVSPLAIQVIWLFAFALLDIGFCLCSLQLSKVRFAHKVEKQVTGRRWSGCQQGNVFEDSQDFPSLYSRKQDVWAVRIVKHDEACGARRAVLKNAEASWCECISSTYNRLLQEHGKAGCWFMEVWTTWNTLLVVQRAIPSWPWCIGSWTITRLFATESVSWQHA